MSNIIHLKNFNLRIEGYYEALGDHYGGGIGSRLIIYEDSYKYTFIVKGTEEYIDDIVDRLRDMDGIKPLTIEECPAISKLVLAENLKC